MDSYKVISDILKVKRMSRRELARLSGIPEGTLGGLFVRKPDPLPLKYGIPICEALDISLNAIYNFPAQTEAEIISSTMNRYRLSTDEQTTETLLAREDTRKVLLEGAFRNLNPENQLSVVAYATELANLQNASGDDDGGNEKS